MLHATLAWFLIQNDKLRQFPPPSSATEKAAVQLLRKSKDAEHKPITVTLTTIEPSLEQAILTKKTVKDTCEGSKEYIGIGIIFSVLTMRIIEAPEHYPGFKAGLRIGDEIVERETKLDKDGYSIYKVLRDGEPLVFHIRREKICFIEQEPEGE